MAALLFMSLGIPMISAGQDFLRSKRGVQNTYQRGDLNALDYRRLYRYLDTHTYFADWIAFRRSEHGRLLRHWALPGEGFFRFFRSPGSPAIAAVYNADRSMGRERLLFAINPTGADLTIPIGEEVAGAEGTWEMRADQERFYFPRRAPPRRAEALGAGAQLRAVGERGVVTGGIRRRKPRDTYANVCPAKTLASVGPGPFSRRSAFARIHLTAAINTEPIGVPTWQSKSQSTVSDVSVASFSARSSSRACSAPRWMSSRSVTSFRRTISRTC
jgi:hypothetical protein